MVFVGVECVWYLTIVYIKDPAPSTLYRIYSHPRIECRIQVCVHIFVVWKCNSIFLAVIIIVAVVIAVESSYCWYYYSANTPVFPFFFSLFHRHLAQTVWPFSFSVSSWACCCFKYVFELIHHKTLPHYNLSSDCLSFGRNFRLATCFVILLPSDSLCSFLSVFIVDFVLFFEF